MTQTTVSFCVEGAFIVKRAREIAWNDEERAKGMEILGCLMHPEQDAYGLSGEAIIKILDGDATLEGDSRTGIRYVEKSDTKWKAYIEKRKDFFAERASRQADELIERKKSIDMGDGLAGVRQFIQHFAPSEVDPYSTTEERYKLRGGAAIRVGGRKVSKLLLERYVAVVQRIRRGAFLGVSQELQNDPLGFFKLEEKRIAIHDEILKEVGLVREPSNESETNFSIALHEYVTKHVGQLGEKS